MVVRPAAIIIVNDDITTNVQAALVRQLHITEVLDGYDFDARISADSTYINKVKQLDQRLLVKKSLDDLTNRSYADIVAFCSHGLCSTLTNKYGPPLYNFPIIRLYWGQIGIYGLT